MAIKKNQETEETKGTATNATGAAQAGASAASNGGEANGSAGEAPKRRGAPKGPRNKPTFVWTDEMRSRLAEVLRAPVAPGQIRTAGSVAAALNGFPEFKERAVDAQRVQGHMSLIEKNLKKDGKTPAPWFRLDKARTNRIDTSAFTA